MAPGVGALAPLCMVWLANLVSRGGCHACQVPLFYYMLGMILHKTYSP